MSGKAVVIDTNVVVAHFRAKASHDETFQGYEPHVPHVVVAELYAGAFKSHRPTHNRGLIEAFLGSAEALPADLDTAKLYGRIWADLANRGCLIPQNDIWIAALCLQHGMPLVSEDAHFENVDGLEIESL